MVKANKMEIHFGHKFIYSSQMTLVVLPKAFKAILKILQNLKLVISVPI